MLNLQEFSEKSCKVEEKEQRKRNFYRNLPEAKANLSNWRMLKKKRVRES